MRTRTTTAAAAAAIAAALTLTACTAEPSSTPTSTPTADAAPAGALALKPLDEAAITAEFEALADGFGQPGAVLLLRTPDGELVVEHGVTAPGGATPVSVDDHIRVGSNTKTWTGTVILQLVDEDRIGLADPVAMYRPDVPNGENISIEHLLGMRSGLANYTETYALNAALDEDPARVWDPEELVAMGLALPPDFAPGDGFHYSNTNTVLLGLIAEQIEGKPLAEIFHERLFEPLGLTETSFPATDDAGLPSPHSDGHFWWTNVNTIHSSALPPDLLQQAEAGTLLPNDGTFTNPSWAWSAGSGISTAGDLADWVEALVGGDDALLSPDLQAWRVESIVPTSEETGYGWNLARFGQFYGHSGELPGYNSFMGYDPVNDVTLVVWANLAPAADGQGPAATIARALIESLYEQP